MRTLRLLICFIVLLFVLCACSKQSDKVLADTFFYGCAYLDSNHNQVIDEEDVKIGGMFFEISLGFRGTTSEGGCATIVIPGGLNESQWPVTARMRLPEDSDYQLISLEEILLAYPDTHADFLFTK